MSQNLRRQIFLLAASLLYVGPLLAGLSGHGLASVPAFVLAFMAWHLFINHGVLQRIRSTGLTGGAIASLALRVGVQLVLVLFCFGIGRGIGGVAGTMTLLPDYVPLGLSAASIILSSLLYVPDPDDPPAFLAEKLAAIEERGGSSGADGTGPELRGAVRNAAYYAAEHKLLLLEEPLEQGVATEADLDEMLSQMTQLEYQGPALDLLHEYAAQPDADRLWRIGFLRFVGHPDFDASAVNDETVADWVSDALHMHDPQLRDEAIALALSWISRHDFGSRQSSLLADVKDFANTLGEEAAPELRKNLRRLVTLLETPSV